MDKNLSDSYQIESLSAFNSFASCKHGFQPFTIFQFFESKGLNNSKHFMFTMVNMFSGILVEWGIYIKRKVTGKYEKKENYKGSDTIRLSRYNVRGRQEKNI